MIRLLLALALLSPILAARAQDRPGVCADGSAAYRLLRIERIDGFDVYFYDLDNPYCPDPHAPPPEPPAPTPLPPPPPGPVRAWLPLVGGR